MLSHRVACSCLSFVLCLICCVLPSASHFVDPTVAAFPIRPVEDGVSHTVRLPAPSSTTCTFTYTTEPQVVNTVKATRFDMAGWLSSMQGRGECARTTSNYWEYEVCLLSGVKQTKQSDSYGLGKRTVVKADSILFTDGDRCFTADYNGPRETTVKLACDASSGSLRLQSITEPQTCRYEALLSSPAVCGDSRFPVLEAGASSEEKSAEDWFLEITNLHGHDSHTRAGGGQQAGSGGHSVEVMCSVYSLEPRAKRSDLNFKQWQLRIDRADHQQQQQDEVGVEGMQEGGHSAQEVRLPLYVARHPGRLPMSDEELELQLDESSHSIRNSDDFNGQLAFVKLYA